MKLFRVDDVLRVENSPLLLLIATIRCVKNAVLKMKQKHLTDPLSLKFLIPSKKCAT